MVVEQGKALDGESSRLCFDLVICFSGGVNVIRARSTHTCQEKMREISITLYLGHAGRLGMLRARRRVLQNYPIVAGADCKQYAARKEMTK